MSINSHNLNPLEYFLAITCFVTSNLFLKININIDEIYMHLIKGFISLCFMLAGLFLSHYIKRLLKHIEISKTFTKSVIKYAIILCVFITIAFSVFFLTGCNSEKRCARVKARHPECIPTIMVPVETTRYDTTYRSYTDVDTVFRFDTSGIDTFIITTDKVKTTIIRTHDTLMVRQVVKPDTIITTIHEKGLPYPVIKPFIPRWVTLLAFLMVLIIFLPRVFKKR